MSQIISGPGVGLPLPQNLYPTAILPGAPYDSSSNKIALAPGEELPIPAGQWYVNLGCYCILEYLDPITNIWAAGNTAGWDGGIRYVKSDGFTVRVANRLACPIGAAILVGGTAYVQGSTTISVTGGGGSTWVPIIGGSLTMSTTTIVTANAGAGYGVAPIVIIPPPPPASNNANGVGGIPATGYATIASGTVSGFTFTNVGAGYTGTTFNVACLPNPTDPNISSGITLGTVTFTVGGSGVLTGVLCTNSGAPLSNPANISLVVSGVGSSASINPIVLQCITAASLIGGSTIGTTSGSLVLATTVGGYPNQGSIAASPDNLLIAGRPRPAAIALVVGGVGTLAAQVGIIYDAGFFYSVPSPVIVDNSLIAATGTIVGSSTLSYTMGGKQDVITMQPAP